jgi:hypothetical protein
LAFQMLLFCSFSLTGFAAAYEYKILSTFRASTMEKQMNEAAEAGFVFGDVMHGETPARQDEVVVVMQKDSSTALAGKRVYKVLATTRTSTMEKEIQRLGEDGFQYKAQTEFMASTAGREIALIMERDMSAPMRKIEYKMLATVRMSTMEKELREAGAVGFHLAAMTAAKGFFGAEEICILRKD